MWIVFVKHGFCLLEISSMKLLWIDPQIGFPKRCWYISIFNMKQIFWSTDWRVEIRWQQIIRQTRRFLFSHIVVSIHVSGTYQLRHIFRLEWPTQLKFHGIEVRSITMGARFWSAFFPYLYSLLFFFLFFSPSYARHTSFKFFVTYISLRSKTNRARVPYRVCIYK